MRKKGLFTPFPSSKRLKKWQKECPNSNCLNKLTLCTWHGIFVGSLQLCKPGLSSQHANDRVPTHTYSSSSFPSKGDDGHYPQKFGLGHQKKKKRKKEKKRKMPYTQIRDIQHMMQLFSYVANYKSISSKRTNWKLHHHYRGEKEKVYLQHVISCTRFFILSL